MHGWATDWPSATDRTGKLVAVWRNSPMRETGTRKRGRVGSPGQEAAQVAAKSWQIGSSPIASIGARRAQTLRTSASWSVGRTQRSVS